MELDPGPAKSFVLAYQVESDQEFRMQRGDYFETLNSLSVSDILYPFLVMRLGAPCFYVSRHPVHVQGLTVTGGLMLNLNRITCDSVF